MSNSISEDISRVYHSQRLKEVAVAALVTWFLLAAFGSVWALDQAGMWDEAAAVAFAAGMQGAFGGMAVSLYIRRWLR